MSWHRAELIPWFLGVCALPHLILVPWAGRWVEKWTPLRTLVLTDQSRALLFLFVALFWFYIPQFNGALTNSMTNSSVALVVLFSLNFVSNIGACLFNPAIYSIPVLLPAPVGETQENFTGHLNGILQLMISVSSVLGPLLTLALGALFSEKVSLPLLFLLNAVSFWGAAVLESKIKLGPGKNQTSKDSSLDSLRGKVNAGFTPKSAARTPWLVTRRNPLIFVMLFGFLASNLFLAPLMVFLPLYATERFAGQLGIYSGFEMALALGTVMGGAWMSISNWASAENSSLLLRRLSWGLGSLALFYIFFSISSHALVAAVLLWGLGLVLSLANVLIMTLFQSKTPESDLPVFMSVVNLIGMASLPVSMTVLGILQKHFSVTSLAIFCSASLGIVTSWLIFHLEKSRAHPDASSSKAPHIDPHGA